MATSAYKIFRAVNKPIEFKGLRGQYIVYAGIVLVGDLLLFASLYLFGVNSYICLLIATGIGGVGIVWTYRLSNKYGASGLLKKRARRGIPRKIRSFTRKTFTQLKKHEKDIKPVTANLRNNK